MPKGHGQKLKLMYIAKILDEETDEDNPITIDGLISRLEDNGISAERKSLYDDIEQLRTFGYDIISERKKGGCYYYIGSREFELAELKLLADAVASAKFISEKKSGALIEKLGKLTSKNLSGQIRRQVFVSGRVKTLNENVFYHVDALHNAISANRQVSFKYYMYGTEKNENGKPVKIYRGEIRYISPYALVWDDENYYCLAYDNSHPNRVTHFRVDKMEGVTITDKIRLPLPEGIDIKEYGNRVFGMYALERTDVDLCVADDLVGVFYDRFGKEIPVISNGNGTFNTHFQTYAGPPLIGWLMQFGDKVKILAPESLKNAVLKTSEQILKTAIPR